VKKKRFVSKVKSTELFFLPTPYRRGAATAVEVVPLPGRGLRRPRRDRGLRRGRGRWPKRQRSAGPVACELRKLGHGWRLQEYVVSSRGPARPWNVLRMPGEREPRRSRAREARPWPEATGGRRFPGRESGTPCLSAGR
jgi:hypothetical protein